MECKGVVHDVLDAAEQFIGRKLWRRFTNFDFFGVRAAGDREGDPPDKLSGGLIAGRCCACQDASCRPRPIRWPIRP